MAVVGAIQRRRPGMRGWATAISQARVAKSRPADASVYSDSMASVERRCSSNRAPRQAAWPGGHTSAINASSAEFIRQQAGRARSGDHRTHRGLAWPSGAAARDREFRRARSHRRDRGTTNPRHPSRSLLDGLEGEIKRSIDRSVVAPASRVANLTLMEIRAGHEHLPPSHA